MNTAVCLLCVLVFITVVNGTKFRLKEKPPQYPNYPDDSDIHEPIPLKHSVIWKRSYTARHADTKGNCDGQVYSLYIFHCCDGYLIERVTSSYCCGQSIAIPNIGDTCNDGIIMQHSSLPNIGIFGTGRIVRALVPKLKSFGFQVTAIWGPRTMDVDSCAKHLDISFHTTKVDEVILHKDVNLIFIHCVPYLQAAIAVKALSIGKHVICGTPAGPTQTEFVRMVNAAMYYPTLLTSMLTPLRFLPCFNEMKELISSGYIGDVNFCEIRVQCPDSNVPPNVKFSTSGSTGVIRSRSRDDWGAQASGGALFYDWRADATQGGGVLNRYGIMVIDMIKYLLNSEVKRVNGTLRTYNKYTDNKGWLVIKVQVSCSCSLYYHLGIREITSDDMASIQLDMESGPTVQVMLNSHTYCPYSHEFLVNGTYGSLRVVDTKLYCSRSNRTDCEELLYTEKHEPSVGEDVRDTSTVGNDDSDQEKSPDQQIDLPLPYAIGLDKYVISLSRVFGVEKLFTGDALFLEQCSTFQQGQRSQAVVDAIRISSVQRCWQDVCVQPLDAGQLTGVNGQLTTRHSMYV